MTENKLLSHRFGEALHMAEESDFYSRNGKTWDKTANDIGYFYTSYDFKKSIIEEMNMLDPASTSLDGLSDEVLAFLDRVESRGEEVV
jgi:hypothetical protein